MSNTPQNMLRQSPPSCTTISLRSINNNNKQPQAVPAVSKEQTQEDKNNTDIESTTPPSAHTEPAYAVPTLPLQKWNEPRGNITRLASAFYSMFVFGLNDAAYGALIPYLEPYYNLSYTVVSLIFLCPFAGYTIAAFTNSWFHDSFGQRGIAIIAPTTHIITYITLCLHPPWPVVVVFSCIGGFGNGLIDGAWSSYAGNMVAGNILAGSLHACYSLGATMSPLIITSLIVKHHLPWYYFYYIMTGLSCITLIVCSISFWSQTSTVYRTHHPHEPGDGQNSTTKTALKNRVTWLCSVFFLLYVGAEVALGGWIVSFMLHVRHASPYTSGLTATGFWAGMTIGRSGLGVLTHFLIELTNRPQNPSPNPATTTTHKTSSFIRFLSTLHLTERPIVTTYLLLSITLQLLFWLIPSQTTSIVSVPFLGLFLGPIFPSGIIMATKLLPARLHVSSIGFSTALGGTGGAVFPFVVGAIAARKGVGVVQPVVLAVLVALVGVWWCFPSVKTRRMVDGGDMRNE